MPRPRFVVHIGAHKTGTTYIQHRLWAARPALAAAGIAVPPLFARAPDEPGHHDLPRLLAAGDPSVAAALGAIDARLAVLSAEDLGRMPPPTIAALRDAVGGAEIVFYCRRWSDLLPSVWQERIRHGMSEPWPDFVRAALADARRLSFVDFGLLLDRFAAVFGRASIRLASYDNVVASGIDLADHFAAAFLPGAPALPSALDGRANPAMPPAEAEAIRALNAARAASGGPGDAALREWLHGAPDARGLADLAAVAERALTRSALSDTDPVLEALHLNLWVAWGDRLVEPAGQGALFPSARREVIHADARWSDAPGPRAAIARILAMFRAETGLR